MTSLLHRVLLLVLLSVAGAAPGLADGHDSERFAGKLLVADTSMPDPRFDRSVIYLVRHDDAGAFGLIVNKPLIRLPLSEMLRQLDGTESETRAELELYFGGPVEGDLGFVLHSRDFAAPQATMTVQDGYAVSGVRDVLRAISQQKGPDKALFVVGYAGWAPDQLEAELERGDWNVVDADEALVFDLPVGEKWLTAHGRRALDL